nr:MAG TPA: hypothetical protein [Caudoviricetes sp.]
MLNLYIQQSAINAAYKRLDGMQVNRCSITECYLTKIKRIQ